MTAPIGLFSMPVRAAPKTSPMPIPYTIRFTFFFIIFFIMEVHRNFPINYTTVNRYSILCK